MSPRSRTARDSLTSSNSATRAPRGLRQHLRPLTRVELRFTPDDAGPEVESWRWPAWSTAAQGPGDLGARLDRAFRAAFTRGADRVSIIGSDCPEIGCADIEEAIACTAETLHQARSLPPVVNRDDL